MLIWRLPCLAHKKGRERAVSFSFVFSLFDLFCVESLVGPFIIKHFLHVQLWLLVFGGPRYSCSLFLIKNRTHTHTGAWIQTSFTRRAVHNLFFNRKTFYDWKMSQTNLFKISISWHSTSKALGMRTDFFVCGCLWRWKLKWMLATEKKPHKVTEKERWR